MKASCVFVLCVLVAALGVTSAITDDERSSIREAMRPHLEECEQEFGLTKEKLLAAKEAGDYDSIDPCFFACFFKKFGIINTSGLFDVDATIEKNKEHIKGEDDIKKITEIGNTCTSVNDQEVGDNEKGCERAKLLVSCFLKEKANFSLFPSSA